MPLIFTSSEVNSGAKYYLDPKYTKVQGHMSPDIYTKPTFFLRSQEEHLRDEKCVECNAIAQDSSSQFAGSTF